MQQTVKHHRNCIILTCFLSVLTCLFLSNTCPAQVMTNDEVDTEATHIKDSLNTHAIDTVMIYKKGCTGCVEGIEYTTFVLWQKDGDNHVQKIDNYTGRSDIKSVFDVFRYYFRHRSIIQSERLTTSFINEHYHYFDISVFVNKDSFHTQLPDYFLYIFDDTYLVDMVYRLEYKLGPLY